MILHLTDGWVHFSIMTVVGAKTVGANTPMQAKHHLLDLADLETVVHCGSHGGSLSTASVAVLTASMMHSVHRSGFSFVVVSQIVTSTCRSTSSLPNDARIGSSRWSAYVFLQLSHWKAFPLLIPREFSVCWRSGLTVRRSDYSVS